MTTFDRRRRRALLLGLVVFAALMAVVVRGHDGIPASNALAAPAMQAAGGTLQATAAPVPSYTSIVLEWTTKSEVNTAGFNMYRADSAAGPFVQINRELIPSAGDAIAGGHYVFTDTEAVTGRTYYYQLEDVEFSGNRTRHDTITTTAQAATARIGGFDATLVLYTFGALITIIVLGFALWRLRG